MHKNNTSEALRILSRWVLSMVEITDENKKRNLLVCLTSIFSTFFNTKSFSTVINYLNLLFINIALRLGHVNIIKIKNSKYNITFETTIDFEKVLGIVIWKT